MSEEEREIDVELDDGYEERDPRLDSVAAGMSENKRALHNAMERKRRDSIKDSFRGLQECIPTLRGDKTSRAQVLKKTGDYISHMQKKIASHQDEIKDLKSQNANLEAQIRALEKAKASGNFLSTASILEHDGLVTDGLDHLEGVGGEIVYSDTSSDASDSQSYQSIVPVAGEPGLVTVTLPTVPGVTVSLPTLQQHTVGANSNAGAALQSAVAAAVGSVSAVSQPLSVAQPAPVSSVSLIQPGQSLLAANNTIRVQPGQSLLLSEPLRKKMKY